jgi:hypothetical protein
MIVSLFNPVMDGFLAVVLSIAYLAFIYYAGMYAVVNRFGSTLNKYFAFVFVGLLGDVWLTVIVGLLIWWPEWGIAFWTFFIIGWLIELIHLPGV